jgi:hypothetical protein
LLNSHVNLSDRADEATLFTVLDHECGVLLAFAFGCPHLARFPIIDAFVLNVAMIFILFALVAIIVQVADVTGATL